LFTALVAYNLIGLFNNIPVDLFTYDKVLLQKVSERSKVYVSKSRLKDAGLGLFCATGRVLKNVIHIFLIFLVL